MVKWPAGAPFGRTLLNEEPKSVNESVCTVLKLEIAWASGAARLVKLKADIRQPGSIHLKLVVIINSPLVVLNDSLLPFPEGLLHGCRESHGALMHCLRRNRCDNSGYI